MDEHLDLLVRLQEIDTAIRANTAKKERLPAAAKELEQRRSANREKVEAAKAALAAAQKAKRDRDKDLEAGQQKTEKLKSRTSEIKTNKEYQALLKEIEANEAENKKIEDDILVLMEKIEASSAEVVAAEKKAAEEDALLEAEQKELERLLAGIDEELKALEQKREDIAGRIPSTVLLRYQRLAAAASGVAVVEAKNESCTGCHMSIPPQVYVNVKKNNSIISCPHCGRILYYKEIEVK